MTAIMAAFGSGARLDKISPSFSELFWLGTSLSLLLGISLLKTRVY
jgi:hypothetical protein